MEKRFHDLGINTGLQVETQHIINTTYARLIVCALSHRVYTEEKQRNVSALPQACRLCQIFFPKNTLILVLDRNDNGHDDEEDDQC